MKYFFYILLFFQTMNVSGQVYLNDTSLYNSNWCSYNSVYEVDTGYFLMGNTARFSNNNRLDLFLGFTTKNNEKRIVLESQEVNTDQKVFGGLHKLFKNNNGNFVYLFNNCKIGVGCYPRLKEVTPDGFVVNDTLLKSLLDSAKLSVLDFNNFIQTGNNNYFLALNVVDTAVINTQGLMEMVFF